MKHGLWVDQYYYDGFAICCRQKLGMECGFKNVRVLYYTIGSRSGPTGCKLYNGVRFSVNMYYRSSAGTINARLISRYRSAHLHCPCTEVTLCT